MRLIAASTFVTCALLAACSSKAPADPRIAEIRAAVTAEKTQFDEYQRIQGPEHALKNENGFILICADLYAHHFCSCLYSL